MQSDEARHIVGRILRTTLHHQRPKSAHMLIFCFAKHHGTSKPILEAHHLQGVCEVCAQIPHSHIVLLLSASMLAAERENMQTPSNTTGGPFSTVDVFSSWMFKHVGCAIKYCSIQQSKLLLCPKLLLYLGRNSLTITTI